MSGGKPPRATGRETDDHNVVHARMMREKLCEGLFEDREIEITVREKQAVPIIGMMGPDQFDPGMASDAREAPARSARTAGG